MQETRSERALIVLDMTHHFTHPHGQGYIAPSKEIVPFVEGELKYFRERLRPVIFCNSQHGSKENGKVIHSLSPRTGEWVVAKKGENAFFETDLTDILRELKVKNLTIVGVSTHKSVIVTAACALERGFSVVVPETCVASADSNHHLAALNLINCWLHD